MPDAEVNMGATTLAEPATITVDEAARFLGISRRHAYNAAERGEIPAIRVGRRILIPRRRLLELLEGTSMGKIARRAAKGRP